MKPVLCRAAVQWGWYQKQGESAEAAAAPQGLGVRHPLGSGRSLRRFDKAGVSVWKMSSSSSQTSWQDAGVAGRG